MLKTIFEKNKSNLSGRFEDIEFPTSLYKKWLPNFAEENDQLNLPELPEVEVVRHFSNLSRDNYGVDNGTYPLGSCTMKYNPKRNDLIAGLDGFRHVHPKQNIKSMQGIWRFMWDLQSMIGELMGMDYVSLQPAAGANGELAGLLVIKKHFEQKRMLDRKVILIADSAHGTNPASATMAGFDCRIVPTDSKGLMNVDELKKQLDGDVAALMLTNPSTLGLFEERIEEIAELLHDNGSLLYYDGANMNALMGFVRPGDMGFDVIHINTHKTLSTPHGGGGPGAGPIGVKAELKPYLPVPFIAETNEGYGPVFDSDLSIGRMKSHFGHIDVLLRAYAYIISLGAEGLKLATEHAVLNANYLQKKLEEIIPPVYDSFCMHECLLNGDKLEISVYTFVKRLIDYGIHPPTLVGAGCVYFSEDLKSAMLIEPTETETKEQLDRIVEVFYKVLDEVHDDRAFVEKAPYSKNISQVSVDAEEIY